MNHLSPMVIGVDETGMGSWAGPLVVSAVLVSQSWSDSAVKDSKKYSDSKSMTAHEKRLHTVHEAIMPVAQHIAVATIGSAELDAIGIKRAWFRLVTKVIQDCLFFVPDASVIVDGTDTKGLPGLVQAVPKADSLIPAVSAASVVAKVERDTLLYRLDSQYPDYGFRNHAGYGTKEHEAAILRVGLCAEHRRSYQPIKRLGAQWESLQRKSATLG